MTPPSARGPSIRPPTNTGDDLVLAGAGGLDDAHQVGVVGPDEPPEGAGGPDEPPEGAGGPDEPPEGAGGPDELPEGAGGRDDAIPSLSVNVRSIASLENLSPYDANARVLNLTFGRADLQPDPDIEIDTLLSNNVKSGVGGQIHREPHRQFRYIRDDNILYSSHHGRYKCSRRKCSNLSDVPNNCLFHPQWLLPEEFQFCGQNCKGTFCTCLKYSKF